MGFEVGFPRDLVFVGSSIRLDIIVSPYLVLMWHIFDLGGE